MKIGQISSFFYTIFSRMQTGCQYLQKKYCYSVQIWENTDQKTLRISPVFTQQIFLCIKETNCDLIPDNLFSFYEVAHSFRNPFFLPPESVTKP